MKQAQVTTWGESPKLHDVAPPALPADDTLVQVKVLAAGLHGVVRLRATGTHYSAHGLPHIPGSDGVGSTPDGKLVYFSSMTPQGGSFTELINLPRATVVPVPEGANPVQVAGLVNPTMASWMAFAARLTNLPANFTVAIVGATTLSGTVAVSVSRLFGAGKVVGLARSAAKMASLGLDATVELKDDAASTDYSAALDADVILDFLWGPAAMGLLEALRPGKPVQFVQIGTLAGRNAEFNGDLLRGKDITMRGTGPGAWQMSQMFQESPKIVEAIATGKVSPHPFQEIKLENIESAWEHKGTGRVVIVP
ncbi:GroES-like protein [Thozetella sp. PMI_491]|nr:GroES-like protein [Thozetella sp. PMI_491]